MFDDASVTAHRKEIRDEILNLIVTSYDESDRAAVIVAAADFDADLENLLTLALLPASSRQDSIFESDRLLGTFSSKIILCQRLGIISSELMRSLEIVRRIRNDFAHRVDESFSSEKQRPRLLELISLVKKSKMYFLCLELFPDKNSPKAQFVAAASVVSLAIKSGIWTVKRATVERAICVPDDA